MNQPLFRKEAIENQQERLYGDIILSQPISFVLLTAFLALIVISALLFLILNNYTRKENVMGYLVPDKGLVAVYSPQHGILTRLNVSEGMLVDENDDMLSVMIDQRATSGEYVGHQLIDELKSQENNLKRDLELEKIRTETEIMRQELKAKQLANEIKQTKGLIKIQKELSDLEFKSYARYERLLKDGLASANEVDNGYKKYLEKVQQLDNLKMRRADKAAELSQIKVNIKALKVNSERELVEIQTNLSEISKQRTRVEGQREIVVRSPIQGRVTSIIANLGQRLNPSVPIFSIIPEDSKLEAHLFVPTRAVGFLQEGQPLEIRYEAYPYQRFGMHPGEINQISKCVISPSEVQLALPINEPVYKVVANLKNQTVTAYGNQEILKPGMMLTADVVLDNRSLFEWMLEPLYSLKGRI